MTKDNVEAFYENCAAIKRHGEQRKYDEAVVYVEKALRVLGFSIKRDNGVGPRDRTESLIKDFVIYWHGNSRPYYKWINYQDVSRDWYINAEIKEARAKMKVSIRPITLLLLEIAQSIGKAYDK